MPKEHLNTHERIHCKSWADKVLYKAPLTKDFFNPEIHHSRYLNTTAIKDIRAEFNNIVEFAYKTNASDANQAFSVKKFYKYIKQREQQVYNEEITVDKFKDVMSKIRIIITLINSTNDYQQLDMTKAITKATNRIEAYQS